MNKILLLILVLSTISCRDKADKSGTQVKVDNSQDSVKNTTDKLIDGPTADFDILVKILDSLGYSSDTVRVKKYKNYKELLDCEILMSGKFPFYKVDKEKAQVLYWNSIAKNKADTIDTKIFRGAESVWAYYYQKKETKNLRTDGVIEQWRFGDEATAQSALDKLNSIYPRPYFNTHPYYLVRGQLLFIFQTQAMAFSYGQKDFFEKFREISSAPNKVHMP